MDGGVDNSGGEEWIAFHAADVVVAAGDCVSEGGDGIFLLGGDDAGVVVADDGIFRGDLELSEESGFSAGVFAAGEGLGRFTGEGGDSVAALFFSEGRSGEGGCGREDHCQKKE